MSKQSNEMTERGDQELPGMETPTDQAPSAAGPPTAPTAEAPAGPAEPAPLTAEEIQQLKAKAAKADEYWDRLLRQAADMDNLKKRSARERQDAIKYATEGLLDKLISVLDHFDMALASANSTANASPDSFRTGITLIYNQLRSVVAEAGLEEIDATNKPFDPTWHEAVSQQESAEVPEGHVLQQLRKGYRLRDRLLRPATVVVAKKPAA
jgi:molecular chaperone GrpE